ncbi:MAG: superoxide dismutase [Caulobacteraceae bacterium]
MFELPALPYAYDALSPVISERTMQFHHDKHHAAYVKTVNDMTAGAASRTLEAVIREAASASPKKLFNNAAQAWNHAFFWASMTPSPERPSPELAAAISAAFGDAGTLKTKVVEEGAGHFGSGWVWLLSDKQGRLEVRSTHDAEDLVTQPDVTPLLVCDLWEHAYYLDHQNNRKGFLEAWCERLPNWSFAARQFAAAKGQGEAWRYPAPSGAADLKGAAG